MPPRCRRLPLLFILLLAVRPLSAAAASSIAAAPASYRRISWASNLTLLGSASLLPGAAAVALTTPSRDGVGAGRALFSEPVRLLLPQDAAASASASRAATPASFSTRFTFRITPSPTYGDGLAFLLTSSRTFLGASNGFLGLFPSSSASDEGELRDVSTVAVEIDTHLDVALHDPDGNHVALDAGSIFSVASAQPGVDLKAGVPITAWVEYRAPRRRLNVWLSYSPSRRPEKPALSADVDLSGLLRTYMYAGFSASNGNGAALHVVERWTFRTFGFPNSSYAPPPTKYIGPMPPNNQPLPPPPSPSPSPPPPLHLHPPLLLLLRLRLRLLLHAAAAVSPAHEHRRRPAIHRRHRTQLALLATTTTIRGEIRAHNSSPESGFDRSGRGGSDWDLFLLRIGCCDRGASEASTWSARAAGRERGGNPRVARVLGLLLLLRWFWFLPWRAWFRLGWLARLRFF